MFDAFISHSSKDKEKIVLELVQKLEKNNIDVWLDANEILAGDTILDAVEKGVATALCTTYHYTRFFESFWTPVEIGLAIGQNNNHKLIPVLCNVSVEDIAQRFPMLLSLKYIKLDPDNIDLCVDELCSNIIQIKKNMKKIFPKYLSTKL